MTADNSEWHIVECGTTQFNVPKQYQGFTAIGHGAFDSLQQSSLFSSPRWTTKTLPSKRCCVHFKVKRTYRELKLLIHLNHRDTQVCSEERVSFSFTVLCRPFRLCNCSMFLRRKKVSTIFKRCRFAPVWGASFLPVCLLKIFCVELRQLWPEKSDHTRKTFHRGSHPTVDLLSSAWIKIHSFSRRHSSSKNDTSSLSPSNIAFFSTRI